MKQYGITRAAAADENIRPRELRERFYRSRNRLRGEGEEGRLHIGVVGWRGEGAEVTFEPTDGKLLRARAFGGGLREIRFGEQGAQQRRYDAAAGGESAIAVHRRLKDASAPSVEQRVAGARVKTEDGRGRCGG